ncbi:ABC-type multidrug transport system, ATPase and permease component [Zhouia amylolytica]|uniref:ATPase n=2 Tax=Zhouia amylolytica TaxID=376730 RepID=W2UL97_9FLAO|nr:ABC transporter ATP-binding protein [Zhouia amylolytica]ETN94950.1 ATPase [Zhouia amylolytica AD3]MCQ0110543.1 ABC transporter ATP-binding protein [Zhouia amylolytica]SFS65434.1 ABC-type multidrug transport system, ATPase and permease component [Zhouia amylolytica]
MSKEKGKAFDLSLFNRLMKYSSPYKLIFYGVALAAVLLSGFAVARPYLLMITVDDYIVTKDDYGLLIFSLLMIGLLFFEVVCQLLFVYYANLLGQSIIRDLRIKLFEHLLSFKMKYFDNSSVGVLVTRAVSDIERIAAIFSDGLFMIISDLLKMTVVAGVMLYADWKMALIVFAVMPIILYATRLFQKAMKVAFIEVRAQVSQLNSFVQERLSGMKIVQLFGREKEEYERFKQINEKHQNAWLKTVWYNSIFFPVAELMSSVTIGLIVWYAVLQDAQQSSFTPGVIFMFIQLTQMLFRPLRQIADKFNTLQMGMVAANRVFGILDTDSKIEDKGDLEAEVINGDVAFNDVRFGYLEEEEVLHGISFEAKAGQTIAIVGATGAGKSTIINLLNRFYDINSGEITVDGVSVNNYTLPSLRKHIAIVLQDVFLFADTIFNNITLKNPDITEAEVVEAAKQIGIHDFIMSLPGNYHYNVKERGGMLSSGQRQLIAFLRAYVSNPSILILDEATSSVDSYSEELIQEATKKITEGRTSIIIAHRLATVKKADKILVMDSGNIVEEGTHKELLKIEGGYYRNLYEVQFMQEEVV